MAKPINKSLNNKITEIDHEVNGLLNCTSFISYDKKDYRDLSLLKTYTIDDRETIEIDDAISLEKINQQFKVWVHIASPAALINYDSALDRQARKKNSSLYLCNKIEYMFPEIIVDRLFSLKEKENRFAISVGAIIEDNGEISSYEVTKSIVKPIYRLNYDDADELLDYVPEEEEDLYLIYKLINLRRNWRKKNGAREIIESQGKIKVKGDIPYIKIIEPTPSRKLISESMVLYGDIISMFTKENNIPIPYRVQDSIKNESIGFKPRGSIMTNYLLKKTMGKTYYTSKSLKHSSLGLASYTHSSSPIRRYADLLIHYQITNFLNNKKLISMLEMEKLINNLNKLSRQNINKYREDQKEWIMRWFKGKKNKVYKCVLLSWINLNKNISILYFNDYYFTQICILETKYDINVGDEIKIKNETTSWDETICFVQVK